MGRTFEVLGGRMRRAAEGESSNALRFPSIDRDPEPDTVKLVPESPDDLPGDDNELPHIEVGAPRAKIHTEAPTPTVPPKVESAQIDTPNVAFHLLSPSVEPLRGLASDLIAYHKPEHPASRQFRQLADGIAAQHAASRTPVLLFTPASTRSVGGTTAVNLAAIRAADGRGRILVIEAEQAPGSAAERLGAFSMPGLRELLARTVPTSLAIHRTPIDGVFIIPEGKTRIGTEESKRLPALLEQLRHRFDWIIVDGPIWNLQNLGEWTQSCDSIYLVLRPDEWESPHTDAAAEGIRFAGGQLRGCVTTAA